MSAVLTFLIRVLIAFMFVMTILAIVQTVRVERLKEDSRELTTANEKLTTELADVKKKRETENENAKKSVERLTKFCETERTAALNAGRAIERMLNGDPSNPNSDPRIIGADELRQLVGPGA